MSPRVLLRAASGPTTGMGHAMRTRAVAQELVAAGAAPLLVVDDAATCGHLRADGFDVVTADRDETWVEEPASAAWLDGFRDWSPELAALRDRGVFTILVENRSPAREICDRLVYPALHYRPDGWDREHEERVLGGAQWIPLSREVLETRPASERDVDLLITFGGSDPHELTERVLTSVDLTFGRIVVSVGPHMAARRTAVQALAAAGRDVRVLSPGTPLPRWMARARAAVTALGTTLYELAHLGVPALIVANPDADRRALERYPACWPHRPLGVCDELSEEGLRAALARGLAEIAAGGAPPDADLGGGARRIAELLDGGAGRLSA